MVRLQPISKSAPIDFAVLAVNYLCAITVEHDYSVKHIGRDFLGAKTDLAFNFPMQIDISIVSPAFHFSLPLG